jgi:outer membrane protein TolC
LTIDEVRGAARESLDAIRARLDVERAGASATLARSSIFPQVAFTSGVSDYLSGPQRLFSTVPQVDEAGTTTFVQRAVDIPSASRGNFSLGLLVNQLLFDGGKWWSQIAVAGAQEEAARAQLEEQRLSSELEAVRRFHELLKAQLALQVFEQAVKRSSEQVDRAAGLYEAGRVQRREWLDARTNLGNDHIAVIRQKQQMTSTRLQLLQWLGRKDEAVEAVPPERSATRGEVVEIEAAIRKAQKLRPLFRVIEHQVQAQEKAIDVARADYFPRVSAQLGYQRSAPSADPFFVDWSRQNALTVGASFSWDVFSGHQTTAQVAKARIEQNVLLAQHRQAVADLEADIRRSVSALKAELEVSGIARENLELAQQQHQLESDRYSAGAGSTLEVRNAQIKVTQAQLALLQGDADVEVAAAAVRRAVGESLEANP